MPLGLFIVPVRLETHDPARTVAKLRLIAADARCALASSLPTDRIRKRPMNEYDLSP